MGAACIFVASAAISTARAQVAYTNSVLNGCYAHLSTSVDDDSGVARAVLGTFCFDGNGNMVGTSGTPGLSGHVMNTNGKVKSEGDETGTYSVTNSPGDGMGVIQGACGTRAFVIAHVNASGIAQGFRYINIAKNSSCGNKPLGVDSGSAEYQGPLN